MTGWDGERGEGGTEWESSGMGGREEERNERVREAHETLCLKASCSPSSWRLFKKIGQRNDETNARTGDQRRAPFRDQFENPFHSSATSLSTRATRSDPSDTHAPVQDPLSLSLSSQPIRSRYHFTSSREEEEEGEESAAWCP